jgi:predicted enzyme related to lactoylglutathione lyase
LKSVAVAIVAAVPLVAFAQGNTAPTEEKIMERVQGIGGFFFRAKDREALAVWYETHLGVTRVASNYDDPPWRSEAGTTVFVPFDQETDYFGERRLQWMINFRVRDLDAMVSQLRAAGIVVEVDPEIYPNGRFAKLNDPEGNPIQLWQPGGKDPG